MNLTLEDFSIEEIEEFMQTEEYDQLDEISKKTLGSYVKKASRELPSISSDASEGWGDSAKRSERQERTRIKGISQAVDKLTKEEYEMIVDSYDFLDNLMNGNSSDAKDILGNILHTKATDYVQSKKQEIASSIFEPKFDPSEEEE